MQTKMTYCVTADGTIVHAEAQISEEDAQHDPVFAYPFKFPDIIGHNLFNFISGAEVRDIYRKFHERILETGRSLTFDYRCDSPETRRDMRMSLTFDNNRVRYESVVLKETLRPVALPSPTASTIIPVCSNCNQYRYPASSREWKEIDTILSEPGLPEQFNFTHTFCEPCSERFLEEISSN